MDRLAAMRAFVHAVQAGSLSGAGRQLGMPLPTVSRKISDLEAHLKARLLHRSTRALALTDAGKTYLAACQRILADVTEAERSAAGEYIAPTGELIVTAPLVFGRTHALPVITDFLAAQPQVQVRLILGDRTLSLLEDHLDLAIRIGDLPDSGLIARSLGFVHLVTCASPGYLARHGIPKAPRDLVRHACVTFSGLMSPDSWSFETAEGTVTAPVRSRLTVTTAEAAIDAAIAGAGITRVMSYQVEPALKSRSLARVLGRFESRPLPVSLVFGAERLLPLKLRAFLDFAVPRLRKALAAPAARARKRVR